MNSPTQCKFFVNCPEPAGSPLIGYNAEPSEVIQFLGRGFGPLTPPPLNWSFQLTSAYASTFSPYSQSAADSAAVALATANAEATWSADGQTNPAEYGDDAFPNPLDPGLPPLI